MLTTNRQKITIVPTNLKPKGFQAVCLWFMLILGIPSFFVGGFVLVILGIFTLFVLPNKAKNNYPMSFVLDEERLYGYSWGEKQIWSIPWEDIEALYIVSLHWASPKGIGLRLKRYEAYQETFLQSQSGTFRKLYSKLFMNRHSLRLARMKFKCEIMLPHNLLDRSAQDFSRLLYTYME